ncbi:MAG: lysophospholipid acyltransferase family protein [Flavobacteriales bacterium]|nr:lysophospholipid acyltransferase family protein [Flavobacteriales bacterium]
MSYYFSSFIYYLLVRPISKLPFGVLYRISDFIFFLIYYILRYRVHVVTSNLKNSFPEKTKEELKAIRKSFYKQFCDNIIEGIKGLTISKDEIARRMVCTNPNLLDDIYADKKSVIIVTGHYYSWELWFLGIDMPVKHQIVLIYKKLSNQYFEKKLKAIRASFGVLPLKFEKVRSYFEFEEAGHQGYIFGSDQAPHHAAKAYWCKFLHQDTPVAYGAEKYAIEKDIPVVFCHIRKIKRGYYEFEYDVIEMNPRQTQYGDITKKHSKRLEEIIRKDPVGWLWTHKRWKREKPKGMVVHDL